MGTENRNGTCVAVVDPITSCGEGTIFDEQTGKCEPTVRCTEGTEANEQGECVPIAECGPGTELDLASGECVPVASCGPGTVFDDASGECLPEASCGAGTTLEDGECVAVGTCAPGSVLNLDTGLCESDTACGPGQIIAGGQCVDPNVAVGLEADTLESFPESNDPAYGGTPEAIALEAVGQQAVFVGNIGRPADLGADGTLAQDRDVWAFAGSAGQLLEISVLGTGLPQPAFVLEGPKGYRRVSALLSTNDAIRQVVLPYDGEYHLIVVPSAFLSTGLPVGSTSSGYVGVIEELAEPSATTVVPSADQSVPAEVTGALRDLSDNYFLIDGAAGDAIALVFKSASAAMPPAIVAFDASGALVTHVDLDLSFGSWVGTLVLDDAGTTVVVDWQSSTTANDAYALQVAEIPHVQGGTLTVGARSETATASVPPNGLAAFTVTLPEPSVFAWELDDIGSPDVQLRATDGSYDLVGSTRSAFFYTAATTYTFFALNTSSTAERPNAILKVDPMPVVDLGTLDPASPTEVSGSGHFLTPDRFGPSSGWLLLRTAGPGLVRLTPSVEIGKPELVLRSASSEELHGHNNARWGVPVHAIVDDEPLLVEVRGSTSSSGSPTFDWAVGATVEPVPSALDVEPNDIFDNAVDLGALPAATTGTFGTNGAVDIYRFALPEPLAEGQMVEVHVENLDARPGTSTSTDGAIVTLYDGLGQVLPTGEFVPSYGTTKHHNVRAYIRASDTQASSGFYIELTEDDFDADHRYLLKVQVVDKLADNEPNDTRDLAGDPVALPAKWEGYFSDSDVLDWFSFTLDEPVGLTELLRLRYDNITSPSSSGQKVVLQDSAGNVLAQGTRGETELTLGGLAAGQYFVSIDGPNNDSAYQLQAEIVPVPPVFELEPNDTAADGTALGELAAGTALERLGITRSSDDDWVTFTLPAALADGEGIRVRCLNVIDSTDLECELYDLADANAPVRLGRFKDNLAAYDTSTDATGPFGVKVVGTSSTADTWYVRVEYGAATDLEPNDDVGTAVPLGTLTAGSVLVTEGWVDKEDEDCFQFSLDGAFPADSSIRVTTENLDQFHAFESSLYDPTAAGEPLLLSHSEEDDAILLTGQTEAGVYTFCLLGTQNGSKTPYRITVDEGPRAELEPNDTGATANALGALPATIHGVISDAAVDVFRFNLPSALGATEAVEVTFAVVHGGTGFNVSLRPGGDASWPRQVEKKTSGVVLSATALPAGDYEIQVDGLHEATFDHDGEVYRIDVRIVDTSITP